MGFNTSAETKREIVATYVKNATILGTNIDLVFKLQLKSLDNVGVGGGT